MSDTDEVQPLSWEVIGRMEQEEYNARRAEILEWLKAHPWRPIKLDTGINYEGLVSGITRVFGHKKDNDHG